MKRPYSANCRPEPTTYRPELAADLRDYFQRGLDTAIKQVAIGSREPVVYPTVALWCRANGLRLNTVYGWRRQRKPGLHEAMSFAAKTRLQLADLSEANGLKLIFDGEADA